MILATAGGTIEFTSSVKIGDLFKGCQLNSRGNFIVFLFKRSYRLLALELTVAPPSRAADKPTSAL